MEYGDFLYIGASGLQFIKTVEFLDYLNWLATDNFRSLETRLISVFHEFHDQDRHQDRPQNGQRREHLPARSTADDIIAGMIVTSEADFTRKTKTDNYYICNAHAVLAVVRHIFTPEFINVLSFYNKRPETRFLVKNYQEILLWILRDVEDLASLYSQEVSQEVLGVTKYRSFIRNRYIHTASLYQVFRQGLYGSFSEHSFADKEPSANIATIRQLIELRLRRAFGVLAFEDAYKHNAIEPLNMSMLFNVLKQYSDKIQIDGIKLENLNRIYTWSNSFIHGGLGDYSWIPFYLEIVLRGVFFGHQNKTGWKAGWSFNNGISTTVSVIRSIWEDLIKGQVRKLI